MPKGPLTPKGYGKNYSGIKVTGIKDAIHNIELVGELLTEGAIRTMGLIGSHTLALAQPHVPLQSTSKGNPVEWGGKLRESGMARVFFGWTGKAGYSISVARGRRDGGVDIDLSKLRGRLGKKRKVRKVTTIVSYQRENEAGEDIAFWAHEELLPWVAKRDKDDKGFRARYPHTGPKYLENAFNYRKNAYIAWIRKNLSAEKLSSIIQKELKVKSLKKTKFSVNIAKLRPSVFRVLEEFEDDMIFADRQGKFVVSRAAYNAIAEQEK